MAQIIQGIQTSLNREPPSRRFYVSSMNPGECYTRKFHMFVTRNGSYGTNMVIALKIPLTAYEKPFKAFKLNYLPLTIPNNDKTHSGLTTLGKA